MCPEAVKELYDSWRQEEEEKERMVRRMRDSRERERQLKIEGSKIEAIIGPNKGFRQEAKGLK